MLGVARCRYVHCCAFYKLCMYTIEPSFLELPRCNQSITPNIHINTPSHMHTGTIIPLHQYILHPNPQPCGTQQHTEHHLQHNGQLNAPSIHHTHAMCCSTWCECVIMVSCTVYLLCIVCLCVYDILMRMLVQ